MINLLGMPIFSTKKTLELKKVTWLSLAETFFGVFIYWWFAIYFNTYLHIILSMSLTPILLLRSPKSIKYALYLMRRYTRPLGFYLKKDGYNTGIYWGIIYLVVFMFGNMLSYKYFSSESIWLVLLLTTFSSLVLITLLLTATSASVALETIRGCIKGGIEATEDNNKSNMIFSGILIGLLAILFSIGFLVRVSLIRIYATFRYLHYGLKNIISNWIEIVFYTDSFKPPELLPNISNHSMLSYLSLDGATKDLSTQDKKVGYKISYTVLFIFLYFPAIMYRISLKSTFWFYFPLIWLASGVQKTPSIKEKNVKKIKLFLTDLYKTPSAKLSFFVGLLVVIGTLGVYYRLYVNHSG